MAAAHGAHLQLTDFFTASAGTRAVVGSPIHHDAALVLEQLGGDPSNFTARRISPKIASAADLVLAMTAAHRDAVLERMPRLLRRTFTLSEASQLADADVDSLAGLADIRTHLRASELVDVADPIGKGPEEFEAVGAQIADLLMPIIDLCRRVSVR